MKKTKTDNKLRHKDVSTCNKDFIIDMCFQYISLLGGPQALDRIKRQIDIELSKPTMETPEKYTAVLETAILDNV